MPKQLKSTPVFASEAEERAFWEDERNDSTDYFDWSKAQMVNFPNLRSSHHEHDESTSSQKEPHATPPLQRAQALP